MFVTLAVSELQQSNRGLVEEINVESDVARRSFQSESLWQSEGTPHLDMTDFILRRNMQRKDWRLK